MNSEIAELLKKKRQEKGLSIDEVHKATKIQPSVIRYLEEGIAAERVGPVYEKSFLKIYSKFLGLDISHLLKEEEKIPKRFLEPPETKKEINFDVFKSLVLEKVGSKLPKIRYLPKKALLFTGAILLVIFIILVIVSAARKKPATTAAKPKETQVSTVKPPSTKKALPDKLTLLISAKEDSWLQVQCDNKTVFERVLTKGSVEKWEAKEKFELRVGNAAGIVIELNGQKIGSLGRRGQVIRNIVMTKEGVTIGK
jgi:cytoskeletal protein RodZ